MIKKSMAFILSVTMLSGMYSVAEATRRRKVLSENLEEEIASGNVSYGDIYYTDNLPGPDSEVDWSGYNYNGVPIKIQDTTGMKNYEPEEITSFSDALRDYMGWDAVLGSTFYDEKEEMLTFKPEGTGSNVIGYSKKKFADTTMKFQARYHVKEPKSDGSFGEWLGIMVRSNDLQYVPWSGMNCYLIAIKQSQVELQKYFPAQEMLHVVEMEPISLEKWYNIEFENAKEEGGMRLRLAIDGKEIFNYLDSAEPFAPDEGYINIYYSGSEIDLRATGSGNANLQEKYDNKILALKPEKNIAYADGETISIDSENENVYPYIKENRTFIPLRFISERMGTEVEWDAETKTVTLKKDGRTMILKPGETQYSIDGEVKEMDVSAEIKENRTFVPVRFVAESFSKYVVWEDETVFIAENKEEITNELKVVVKTMLE